MEAIITTLLKLDASHPKSSSYRATFQLLLNYYFTYIAMGKVSVVTRVRSCLQSRLNLAVQQNFDQDSYHLSRSCIKAAKKILQLYEEVRWTGNLTRFSFTDFQGCSVATCLVLLAGILERDTDYRRHVTFGLDSLHKMAKGNVSATAGLKFVEALQSIADEAVEKLSHATANSPTVAQHLPHALNYTSWVDLLTCQSRQPSHAENLGNQSRPDIEISSFTMGNAALESHQSIDATTSDGTAALRQVYYHQQRPR